MRSLLKDLKPHKREVILAPLFKMLEAGFELFVPLVMRYIMDVSIPANDTGSILFMSLALIGLALIGLGTAVTAQYFSAKAATGYAATLRGKMFRRIQAMSFSKLDEIGASTLITRMTSDVNQVQNGVNLTLRLFLRSPVIVFGAAVMAFIVDGRMAWIFVIAIPLLAVIVFGIMLLTLPMFKKVQGALDGVTKRTRENLTGVRTIRAFRMEKTETEAFFENNRILEGLQKAVGRISAFLNPLTYVLINLAIVAILYFGGRSVSAELMTTGTVIALVNYMNQILIELIKLANLIVQMTRAAAGLNRIEEALKVSPDDETELLADRGAVHKTDRAEEKIPAVRFSHVSMKYETSGEEVLHDITFEVKRGETVGVIGGTGSGKTTLVSLIPGFYPISEGELDIDGKPVFQYDRAELRRKVGIVMQKAVLFKGTVRDTLRMGSEEAAEEELWQAIESAQASDFVREKEGMLDAVVEQEGRNFSGGQKQRLSIARALVKRPEILILDDSSSALDFATDAALRKAIRDLSGDMTVFIVSQRAASIRNADRILVLEDGKLVGQGTHGELLQSCPVYREIVDSQFQS